MYKKIEMIRSVWKGKADRALLPFTTDFQKATKGFKTAPSRGMTELFLSNTASV